MIKEGKNDKEDSTSVWNDREKTLGQSAKLQGK